MIVNANPNSKYLPTKIKVQYSIYYLTLIRKNEWNITEYMCRIINLLLASFNEYIMYDKIDFILSM